MDKDTGERTTRREFMRDAGLLAAVAASGLSTKAFSETAPGGQSANDCIGIGMIGCGGRGSFHVGVLNKLKEKGVNVQIVAVCDAFAPRAKSIGALNKAKVYMDHRELLADPNVDVVGIATPDHIHGYQAIDAVKAGKHVYCEKPVTHWRQFELTKQLAEVVKGSKVAFQVGSQGMSDPAWKIMKDKVKEGLIGQPIHAECGYFRVGDWGERGMPIVDPNAKPGPDLNWEAFLGDSPKRDFDVSRFFRWRMYEDYSGGPGTDLFPHSLTPVVSILGVGMPSIVAATGGMFRYTEREIPDTFNMLIDYPEKITVAVLGTQGNNYSATGDRGAGGRVPVIRGWDGTLTVKGQDVVFIPAEGSEKVAQTFPIPNEGLDTVEAHWQNLMDCAKSGQPTNSPMELQFAVQTAIQMGILGQREGKLAKFDRDAMKIVL